MVRDTCPAPGGFVILPFRETIRVTGVSLWVIGIVRVLAHRSPLYRALHLQSLPRQFAIELGGYRWKACCLKKQSTVCSFQAETNSHLFHPELITLL